MKILACYSAFVLLASCRTLSLSSEPALDSVFIPHLKNSANECYYLDEFMPVPDGIVSGRTGALSLRYYNYKSATYKDYKAVQLNLAFYSNDSKCWSLFEENYAKH
jgi:hypothetical protein